jgi:acyl-CoA thioester hydrolase
MIAYKTEIRVRYADTDQMQLVYNGKYFEYFEVGRTELLREIGLPYRVIEEKGFQLPVVEAFIKYKNPAHYDDLLVVTSKVEESHSLKIHIEYMITKKDNDNIIAEGYTDHVFINKQNGKVVRPPDFYLEIFKVHPVSK